MLVFPVLVYNGCLDCPASSCLSFVFALNVPSPRNRGGYFKDWDWEPLPPPFCEWARSVPRAYMSSWHKNEVWRGWGVEKRENLSNRERSMEGVGSWENLSNRWFLWIDQSWNTSPSSFLRFRSTSEGVGDQSTIPNPNQLIIWLSMFRTALL